MKNHFANLSDGIHRALQPLPNDLVTALRELPAVEDLLTPWATSLLITLVRYRQRQRWAIRALEEHLPQTIPPSEELYARWDRDPPLQLPVPGMPVWELQLECALEFGTLVHKTTGEMISIKVSGEEDDHLMFADSLDRFAKTKPSGSPERRLLALHPTFLTIWYAIDEMEEAGLLEGIDFMGDVYKKGLKPDAHRLTPTAMRLEEPVALFCKHWKNPNHRLWLASLIGDWPLAHKLAQASGAQELLGVTGPRAEQCRQRRLAVARRDENLGPSFIELHVLHEMGADEPGASSPAGASGGSGDDPELRRIG